MAHAQKPDLVFQGKGRVHFNRRGSQFSRVLAVEESESAGSDCISWIDRVPRYIGRALPTRSIRLFPLHFPSRASPCAITFQTDSTVEAVSGRTLLLNCQSFHFVSSVVEHWITQQPWRSVCVFLSCSQRMDNDVDLQNHRYTDNSLLLSVKQTFPLVERHFLLPEINTLYK
jgi:hypothetical protein